MINNIRISTRQRSLHVSQLYWLAVLPLLLFGCKKDEPVEPFVRLLENQKMYSPIFNNDITYAVLLPDGYDQSTETYPVVYLLHGFGDTERAWYTSGGLLYYADQYADDIVPMIYVMPAAYYSYYVNKFSGDYPYMDMMTTELVPTIDSLFRTKKENTSRAVMGYSMGGYGALILPALNPDVFTVAVPLSMSFRTDEQYMAEPQDVFNSQWGNLFGGFGETGTARLTEHFIEHSPFHFFGTGDLSRFDNLKIFVDCGDDEESLSVTSDEMHVVMRDNNIKHEYRVRNGGHSFDYWKKSYPEAFRFISNAFEDIPHPTEPVPVTIGPLIDATSIDRPAVSGLALNIMTPENYSTSSSSFPVLYILHDFEENNREENVTDVFSLLRNTMKTGKLTNSIVVEIPVDEMDITKNLMNEVVAHIDDTYHTKAVRKSRIVVGNDDGGDLAALIGSHSTEVFGSCYLFNAILPDSLIPLAGNLFYYIDVTDECISYTGNNLLYTAIRKMDIDYEYRVHQGSHNYQAFLNGLNESLTSIKETLSN